MKVFLLLLVFSSACFLSYSQGSVHITVKGDDGKPLEFATVVLKKASDSSLFKSNMSDASGLVVFENIPVAGMQTHTVDNARVAFGIVNNHVVPGA